MALIKSKKRYKVLICISAIVVLSLLVVFLLITSKFNKKFYNEESTVDNNYNNSVLSNGDVVMLNNNLYFNYNGYDSIFFFGLYQINQNGSSRVYWSGPSFSPGNDLCNLKCFNSTLLDGVIDDVYLIKNENTLSSEIKNNIYSFDVSDNSFKLFSTIKSNSTVNGYEVVKNKFYFFTDTDICISDDGINIKSVFNNVKDIKKINIMSEESCYINENSIFYISQDGCLKNYDTYLQKYIWSKSLNSLSVSLDDVYKVFANDEYVFIVTSNGDSLEIYKTPCDSLNVAFEKFYSKKIETPNINSYGNKIFISSDATGLDVIDTSDNSSRNILNSGVRDTYVFDEKYLYYIDMSGALNRIRLSDEKTEKIFG